MSSQSPESDARESSLPVPRLRVLIGYALSGLAAILVFALWVGGFVDVGLVAAQLENPEPGAAQATEQPIAADDGTVEIEEHGFTEFSTDSDSPRLSWGATVSNDSESNVAVPTLELRVLDSDGESLTDDYGDAGLGSGLAPIPPGQRSGTGDIVYLDDSGVDKVEIRVKEINWFPPDNEIFEVADLTVGQTEVERIDEGPARGDMEITVDVDSQYEALLTEPDATAIFRDKDDAIIGGSTTVPNGDNTIPPGESRQSFTVMDDPPDPVDEDNTELYINPGVTNPDF